MKANGDKTKGRYIEDVKEEEEKQDSIKEKENKEDKERDEAENEKQNEASASEFGNRGGLPRNASQPAFTTHVQGLPKNGSVPFFDRIRKTSASERYRPNSNGDIRKSLQLRLSNSSFLGASRNNNCDEMWSKPDVSRAGSRVWCVTR